MIRSLTEDEGRYAMEKGEFDPELLKAAEVTAIILTQSWCPQWESLERSLAAIEKTLRNSEGIDTAILYLEYDRVPYFRDFKHFKEGSFKNFSIPYIRYYRWGLLMSESNAVSQEDFIARMKSGS